MSDSGRASQPGLAKLGINDERRHVTLLHEPRQQLRRVFFDHLTRWDWDWPFGPPDAIAPDLPFLGDKSSGDAN